MQAIRTGEDCAATYRNAYEVPDVRLEDPPVFHPTAGEGEAMYDAIADNPAANCDDNHEEVAASSEPRYSTHNGVKAAWPMECTTCMKCTLTPLCSTRQS